MNRVVVVFLVLLAPVMAQDTDRATVPFSDPNGAKRLVCSILHGSITVKAHSSKDVTVEAHGRGGSSSSRREPPPGMRRISSSLTGLTVEESSNTIKVSTSASRTVDVTVYVPAETAVKLNAVNNGSIAVEGISGEIDVNNLNGEVRLTNVSGAVVAHALNGKLYVTLNQVSNKTQSFSTLNGNIDVTLPADLKANLKMKSENGEIFSDFDITLKASPQSGSQSSRDGKTYRIRFDKAMYGTINGGGPELQFTTFNGTIYIRKGK